MDPGRCPRLSPQRTAPTVAIIQAFVQVWVELEHQLEWQPSGITPHPPQSPSPPRLHLVHFQPKHSTVFLCGGGEFGQSLSVIYY